MSDSAKEPSSALLHAPRPQDVTDLWESTSEDRSPSSAVHSEVSGIQLPVMAGVRPGGSNLFSPIITDDIHEGKRCQRSDSVESLSSPSANKQKLSDLLERKDNFNKAIRDTSGESYVSVLRLHKDLFREGHAISQLPENLDYRQLSAVAEILKGVQFKPSVWYSDRESIKSLYALDECESLLKSFEVTIDLTGQRETDDDPFLIPPGACKVDLSEVGLNGDVEEIPYLPRSVKELTLYNNDMCRGPLDFRVFENIEVLYIGGNNITNKQLQNDLKLSPSMQDVYVNVCDDLTDDNESPDVAPDEESFKKLREKYPKCEFHESMS